MKKGLIPFLLLLIFSSCDKGKLKENSAPETSIFLSEINLTGDDRLTSEVELFWTGEDVDGFIVGYELSKDNLNWTFTSSQDSIFRFDINSGSDSLDIDFYVRSVDNNDERDETPAYLKIPIKNSPPSAEILNLDSGEIDTFYTLFSFGLNVLDQDGESTLDSTFLKLNDGDWVGIDPLEKFLTIQPVDPSLTGSVAGKILLGIQAEENQGTIPDLRLNEINTVYLKARDITGTESPIDTSYSFYLKNKSSDLLVLGSHSGISNPKPSDIYKDIINTVYGQFDFINLQKNDSRNFPQFMDPTFSLLINQYDKIFWFTDETAINGSLHLDLAANVIQSYLNQEGKLFISTRLPASIDSSSLIFEFSPMAGISYEPGQARIPIDSKIMPWMDNNSNYDTLICNSFITGADPFYPKDSSGIMFTAELQEVSGWTGPNIVGARTQLLGNTNQVFFSIELHHMSKNPQSLEKLFEQVLLNEFNW